MLNKRTTSDKNVLIPQIPGPSNPNQVIRCGHQKYSGSGFMTDFQTSEYAIIWIKEGLGHIRYGSNEWRLHPGSIFKRLPNQIHNVYFAESYEYFYVAVPAAVTRLMTRCHMPNWDLPHLQIAPQIDLSTRFQALSQELSRSHGLSRFRCLIHMQEFIAEVHELAAQNDPKQAFLQKACQLLQDADEIPIPHIAQRIGIPYSSFRLRFQELLGCSPLQWRIRQRIEQAKNLLEDSDLTINAIAHELHYQDVYRFSKQFKELTGMSPRNWRHEQLHSSFS